MDGHECEQLVALYDNDKRFRSTVNMARHRFGEGEYRYFDYPLPSLVGGLRKSLYRQLAPLANQMMVELGRPFRYPAALDEFTAQCRAQGQQRPTPLLLSYTEGGYNRLHRDLYGEVSFPLQATICLDSPGRDFDGGAFLLLEQRPRMQSSAEAIDLGQGEMIIFPTAERPVKGARGTSRANMRHGVSRLLGGRRHSLGIIFHDAA